MEVKNLSLSSSSVCPIINSSYSVLWFTFIVFDKVCGLATYVTKCILTVYMNPLTISQYCQLNEPWHISYITMTVPTNHLDYSKNYCTVTVLSTMFLVMIKSNFPQVIKYWYFNMRLYSRTQISCTGRISISVSTCTQLKNISDIKNTQAAHT